MQLAYYSPDNKNIRKYASASNVIDTACDNVQLSLVLVGSLPEQQREQNSHSPEAMEPIHSR